MFQTSDFILVILLLLTGVCLLFIINCKKRICIEKYNTDVDIVITWVENSPEFQKEKEKWLSKGGYQKPSIPRYSDNLELKYLLRSIEKNFPNYNNIYLVVKDGQFPKYLKQDSDRLIVINHSDIIPKENLPLFNSRAIEMYIHRIPNLSEYYIYSNDDFIFNNPISKNFYIDDDKLPYVLFTKIPVKRIPIISGESSGFNCGLSFNSYILDKITKKEGRFEVPHTPFMYKRSFDFEIEKYFKNYYMNKNPNINLFDKTGTSKFRRCDDLYMVSILKPYLYKEWFKCKTKIPNATIISEYNKPITIKQDFICLENIDKDNFNNYIKFMDDIFPFKSSFEI